MRANVYKPYTVLTLCVEAVYSLFSKLVSSNHLDGRGGIRTHGALLTHTHFPGAVKKRPECASSLHFSGYVNTTALPALRNAPETPRVTYTKRIQRSFWTRDLRLSEQCSRDLERAIRGELRKAACASAIRTWQ